MIQKALFSSSEEATTVSRHVYPLCARHGHLYALLADSWWLIDTGSPLSFGDRHSLGIGGRDWPLRDSLPMFSLQQLRSFVGVECNGLIGMDVLGQYDCLFDLPAGQLALANDETLFSGPTMRLEHLTNIPVVDVRLSGRSVRAFLDTGAQYSYLPAEALAEAPSLGTVEDFHPTIGRFVTQLHEVTFEIGNETIVAPCGALPEPARLMLLLAGVAGIVGNAVCTNHVLGLASTRGAWSLTSANPGARQ